MHDLLTPSSDARFLDLTFEDDCKSARRDDGAVIRFTRNETALLAALTARPGRPMSREVLLNAMAGRDAEVTDRAVDFTVNRLRRKLDDPARAPRFIRSLYGEGYVWIAPPGGAETGDFLIVYASTPAAGTDARDAALDALAAALSERLPEGRGVRLFASVRDAMACRGARFGIEVSLHPADGALPAALVLVDRHHSAALAAERLDFAAPDADAALARAADALLAAIWRQMTLGRGEIASPSSAPLEVRAHTAAEFLRRSQSLEPRFLEVKPGDSEAVDKLIGAAQMQARLLRKIALGHCDAGVLKGHFRALEGLVLEALPYVQHDPQLTLTAVTLLVDANRDHADMAERLARHAFERTTAFASGYAALGRVLAARDAYDEALTMFDRGLELCEPGSEFEVYLLVWKCWAALAIGDRTAFLTAREALFAAKAETRAHVGLLLFGLDAETEDPAIGQMIAAANPARLRGRIEIAYVLGARVLPDQTAVRRAMGRTALAAIAAHGKSAVPDYVAAVLV